MDADQIRARRQQVMQQLEALEQMRRGSVVEQYREVHRPGGRRSRQGPYPLYTYKEKGRTISRRLKGEHEVQQYRNQIENFRRFEHLMRELIQLGEQLCDLSVPLQEKKQRKLGWKPKRRSDGS
jgi:hypothetical protein